MDNIWILGGTTEGRLLARFCGEHQIPAIVSVATEYGEELVEPASGVQVVTGPMDAGQMERFIRERGIRELIDATHPYAVEVTENAKAACERTGISYVRCLRESRTAGARDSGTGKTHREGGAGGPCGEGEKRAGFEMPEVVYVASPQEAVEFLAAREGAVLLLTGSKTLDSYTALPDFEHRIYARILPEETQVARCRQLGVKGAHLICMQGPFSVEMNAATIRQTGAAYMVTKESGAAGGFEEKLQAAGICGITAVVIGRPAREEGLSLEAIRRRLAPGKKRVYLVGAGMGSEELLTAGALRILRSCGLLMGAKRLLQAASRLAPEAQKQDCYLPEDILAAVREYEGSGPAAVLFSGDTGFYSGAGKAEAVLTEAGYPVTVIPGISSVSYLASKIAQTWGDAKIVSLHGRDSDPAAPFLGGAKKVFYLLDHVHRPEQVLSVLTECGFGRLTAAVGERMGSPGERVCVGTAEELRGQTFDSLSSMFVYESSAARGGEDHE